MSQLYQAVSLTVWLLIIFHVVRAEVVVQRQAYLTKSADQDCQTIPIGDALTASSVLDCCKECMIRFFNVCQSVVYNPYTQRCTPGSIAFALLTDVTNSIPTPGSGDHIYYMRQPIPSCNTASGDFALYDVYATTACLHLSSSKVSYDQAETNCAQMNGRLFVANTMAKFSLIWHVNLKYINTQTWIGLTDRAQEGTYVWANGEQLSTEQEQYIWDKWQPDVDGDCIQIRVDGWWDPNGFNDKDCTQPNYYICEPLDP